MDYSLYLHVPFCVHRCAYCDFNTYAGQEPLIPAYVDALVREIHSVAASASSRLPVHTVFFGGGTPSMLTPAQFAQVFDAIRSSFELSPAAEISMEANPGTVDLPSLQALRSLGLNRISFGVQSANPEELRQLERIHDFFDVIDSVKSAHRAGFDNLNLDLIYGLPGQRLERWQETVRRLVDLNPQHLSLYALTIETGTPYGRWAAHGLLPIPDPDLAADMYEWASEFLEGQGFVQYEISNWSRPGFQCRHNLQYWRDLPYLGLGAGAHGYAASLRYSNVLRIKTYIDRLLPIEQPVPPLAFPLTSAAVAHQQIDPRTEMQETMITGLRLTREGVSSRSFKERFGLELQNAFGKEIEESLQTGLLEWFVPDSDPAAIPVLRLTRRGRLLGNQVFLKFV